MYFTLDLKRQTSIEHKGRLLVLIVIFSNLHLCKKTSQAFHSSSCASHQGLESASPSPATAPPTVPELPSLSPFEVRLAGGNAAGDFSFSSVSLFLILYLGVNDWGRRESLCAIRDLTG